MNALKRLVPFGVAIMVTASASQSWAVSTWTVQTTQNVTTVNVLAGASAVSSTNAFAVGSYIDLNGVRKTLIEHWDGTAWTIQTSPNYGTGDNQLNGVRATSSTNAWAVGTRFQPSSGFFINLILHYDGVSWVKQTNHNYTGTDNRLWAVAATSSSNAFAVGDTIPSGRVCGDEVSAEGVPITPRPVIEHYDGTAWTIMASPDPTRDADSLHGVAALSSTNAWAVGCQGKPNVIAGSSFLVEHYDGTNWAVQTVRDNQSYNELASVSAASASDIWAVGFGYEDSPQDTSVPVIYHYDGTKWKRVAVPFNWGRLLGVKATSATNAWAVGYVLDFYNQTRSPVVVHWDGVSWTLQADFTVGSYDSVLNSVSSTGSTYAFGVGVENTNIDGSTTDTLAMKCC